MIARRNPDGTLTVPARAGDGGRTVGDGVQTIGPDHPDYQEWLAFVEEEPAPRRPDADE